MAEQTEPIGEVVQYTNPPLEIPPHLLISARKNIRGMLPDEIAFTKPGSVLLNSNPEWLLIDTNDPLPPLVDRVSAREVQPAILRIMRLVGNTAYDGYIVDMRSRLKPNIDTRTEPSGYIGGHEDQWKNLGTVNPLGALYVDGNVTEYVGELEFTETASRFCECVDMYYEALAEGEDPKDCLTVAMQHFQMRQNVI